jgi:hypothetical protein
MKTFSNGKIMSVKIHTFMFIRLLLVYQIFKQMKLYVLFINHVFGHLNGQPLCSQGAGIA